MNLQDVRKNYDYFTGKSSDLVRQLGLAGIALVWVFKSEQAGRVFIPGQLRKAAFFIAAGLTLDVLQYVIASLIWGVYNGIQERKKVEPTHKFKVPRPMNWPALACFWAKIAAILIAYAMILPFLAARIRGQ